MPIVLILFIDGQDALVDVAAADVNPTTDTCDEKMFPKVDMLFHGESDVYEFYNAYSENVGFLCPKVNAVEDVKEYNH